MAARRSRHLNSPAERRAFEERYGKEHGDLVWRETLSKVAQEQAARSPTGTKVEHIPGHVSISPKGRRFKVRPHTAEIHSERHSRGHHPGRCTRACRRGEIAHKHPHPRK